MPSWNLSELSKLPALKKGVLICGLPGIGNVGKVCVDFLVHELKAKQIYEITSSSFPHSVFVNEKSLVELPSAQIYHKKMKNCDLLFLCGDVQPVDERGCYDFSRDVLDLMEKHKVKTIVTLGGIGLSDIPKKPKVYVTGNDAAIIKTYAKKDTETKLYGVVGPIVGISGLLVGLSKKRNLEACCILAETYGHPMYLGIKAAREIIRLLDSHFALKVNIKKLEKDIKEIEKEILSNSDPSQEQIQAGAYLKGGKKEVNYIG